MHETAVATIYWVVCWILGKLPSGWALFSRIIDTKLVLLVQMKPRSNHTKYNACKAFWSYSGLKQSSHLHQWQPELAVGCCCTHTQNHSRSCQTETRRSWLALPQTGESNRRGTDEVHRKTLAIWCRLCQEWEWDKVSHQRRTVRSKWNQNQVVLHVVHVHRKGKSSTKQQQDKND